MDSSNAPTDAVVESSQHRNGSGSAAVAGSAVVAALARNI